MKLNAIDKERIAAAVAWAEANPVRTDNALEILDTNSGYPHDPDSAILDKDGNLKSLAGGQSTKG